METDLFDFAYIPDWYGQLEELEGMVLPEPWQFKRPSIETKNQDTPILERYIHIIFRKQSIDYNSAKEKEEAAKYFHIENECACFHTGLYTERYKAIYAFFDRNKRRESMLDWYFRGFRHGRPADQLRRPMRLLYLLHTEPGGLGICRAVFG